MEQLRALLEHRCFHGHWSDTELCFIFSLAWVMEKPRNSQLPPVQNQVVSTASWAFLSSDQPIMYPDRHAKWQGLASIVVGPAGCEMRMESPPAAWIHRDKAVCTSLES